MRPSKRWSNPKQALALFTATMLLLRFGVHALPTMPQTNGFRIRQSLCRTRAFSSSRTETSPTPQTVAIVGGGLAGLSTAYHLVQHAPHLDITILDKKPPGMGGASAVAGG